MEAKSEYLEITADKDGGRAKVSGIAYTGGKMRLLGWARPVVLDFAGMSVPESVPLLAGHKKNTLGRVGLVSAKVKANHLVISGDIGTDSGLCEEIGSHGWAGADWHISIGVEVDCAGLVLEGSRNINGAEQQAPFYNITKCSLREVCFVAEGGGKGRVDESLLAAYRAKKTTPSAPAVSVEKAGMARKTAKPETKPGKGKKNGWPRLSDWEWTTLVGAWRYYEPRNSITAVQFPADIVMRYWGSGRYSTDVLDRIAWQFAACDYGCDGDERWDAMNIKYGQAGWEKFYSFCKAWNDKERGFTIVAAKDGIDTSIDLTRPPCTASTVRNVREGIPCFRSVATGCLYSLSDYIRHPSQSIYMVEEKVEEIGRSGYRQWWDAISGELADAKRDAVKFADHGEWLHSFAPEIHKFLAFTFRHLPFCDRKCEDCKHFGICNKWYDMANNALDSWYERECGGAYGEAAE